jgi:hypothetical protein
MAFRLVVVSLIITYVFISADLLLSMEEAKLLRVKKLRHMLNERGVDCVGCVEKGHLVARVM